MVLGSPRYDGDADLRPYVLLAYAAVPRRKAPRYCPESETISFRSASPKKNISTTASAFFLDELSDDWEP